MVIDNLKTDYFYPGRADGVQRREKSNTQAVVIWEISVNKALDKNFEMDLDRVQSIMEGIDAAKAGYTVPVNQMFNPLRLIASTTNPRSPAVAEPAALELANIISQMSQISPLLAEQVFMAIADMLKKVQDIPDLGEVGRYPNTREIAFFGYPVTLVYTVDEHSTVTVVAAFRTNETLN